MAKEFTKSEREWASLRMVYGERRFASVTHGDRPDFILRHRGTTGRKFGVEVTDFFDSETDGRATLNPHYIGQLLAGGRHWHKDDIDTLAVGAFKLLDSEGNVKEANVPGILRQKVPLHQHLSAVAAVVREKSAKAKHYLSGLSHINLIIVDRDGIAQPIPGEYSTNELLIPQLREALLEAPFLEVFLVSLAHDRRVFRPLQMLILIERFRLFVEALETFDPGSAPLELHDVVPLFGHIMKDLGMRMGLALNSDGTMCAVYGGSGIFHSGNEIKILDFGDHHPPPAVELPKSPLGPERTLAFLKHFSDIVRDNTFVTELALPVLIEDDPVVHS